MRKMAGILIAILFFFSTLGAEETQYTNYTFARLSYMTGKAYIQRAADLGYEEAVLNTAISEGDRIGTTDGRAEIYLGKANYVRLDKDTKIDFLNLPKKGYDLVRIRIWSGNVYINVGSLEEEKDIEIHTSDVSVYVLEEGLYRIDVRQNRETEIFVFEGIVEAAGETGSVLIKDEQRLEASNARFTSRPTPFRAIAEDSFDRWSEHRDSKIRKHLAKAYLPEELEDFEHELAEYGDWVYAPPYGYVWVPGGADPSWRPYYNGRWSWLPLCGWSWIPYEPWGWCTYHYGRWHWRYGLGWYWIPTTIWGPSWVHWYWGYDYIGWVPLSYYGYPGVITNNIYNGRYSGTYYPSNSRVITVIHKNQLSAQNVSKVALNRESVKKLGKIKLSSQRLPLRPKASKVSVETLEGKKLFLKKIDSLSKQERIKRSTQTSIRKPGSIDSKKAVQSSSTSPERKIIKEKSSARTKGSLKKGSYGYPSSSKISIKNYPGKIKTKKSSSYLGRLYKNLTKSSKSIIIRSSGSASQGTTSKRISSSSRSRSSSTSSQTRSSSSRSSSSKVRKKK